MVNNPAFVTLFKILFLLVLLSFIFTVYLKYHFLLVLLSFIFTVIDVFYISI